MRTLLSDLWFDGEELRRSAVRLDLDGPTIASLRALEPGERVPRTTLDVRGALLLPGLINAHVHIARGGAFGPSEALSIRQVVTNLEGTLASGVTTVGDMGCAPALARALASHAARCPGHAPEVRSAGPIFTAPRGYPLDWLPPWVARLGLAQKIGDARDAGPAVDRVVAAGMHHVKLAIMHSSYAGRPMETLAPAAARAVVEAAHARGLLAFAHAHSIADYRLALDAGVDALMHSSFEPLDAETVARVRDAGVPVTPTLWVFEGVCDGPGRGLHEDPRWTAGVSRAIRRDWRAFADAWEASRDVVPPGIAGGLPKARAIDGVRVAAANLRLLRDAGVPIAFGSDAAYGFCVHARPVDELGAMQRAGLTPLEVLRAATSRAAELLAAFDRGRLAPGKRADLLVVPREALDDVTRLEDVRHVIAAGRDVLPAGAAARAHAAYAVVRGVVGAAVDALTSRRPSSKS
jgi:imidazolonepropionase-like amidohydrolase